MFLRNYTLVTDPEDVIPVAQVLDRVPEFALDLETTGLAYKKADVHGISLATEDREWYICQDALQAGFDILKTLTPTKRVIGHNLKFDAHFLRKNGVEVFDAVDTMLAQGLINENADFGLKSLAQTELGINHPLPDFKELQHLAKKMLRAKRISDISIFDIPLHTLAEYAARDARFTFDLWGKLQYKLSVEGMEDLFYKTEMPYMRVLMDMEETGFFIDQEKLAVLEKDFIQKREEAHTRVTSILGKYVDNPGSDAQLRYYFYEVMKYKPTIFTASGLPSVDVQSLSRLRDLDSSGAVEAILNLRKYEKLITTYIVNFREGLVDGRLHGDFNQNGAVTGRLSSSNPNLQNIPARSDEAKLIRELFSAPSQYKFLDIDYSQLELRLGAHYTRDPNLMQVFIDGGDPHQMTADMCNVKRYVGKTLNFLVFYGGSYNKLRDSIEKNGYPRPTVQEAKSYLEAFAGAYPTIDIWKEKVWKVARQLGYVWTISGRRRRLPDINSRDNALRSMAERQAVNSIIQGSATDITKWAQIQIHKFQSDYDAKMLAQVHDEIAWEVHKDAVEDFGRKASEVMVTAGKHFNIRVPMEASPQWGLNWAEAK